MNGSDLNTLIPVYLLYGRVGSYLSRSPVGVLASRRLSWVYVLVNWLLPDFCSVHCSSHRSNYDKVTMAGLHTHMQLRQPRVIFENIALSNKIINFNEPSLYHLRGCSP